VIRGIRSDDAGTIAVKVTEFSGRWRSATQWWSLTREAVERVLSQHRDDEWLRASFQFSAIPDEMYVHTLLGRDVRERFMLADWTRPEKPTTFDTVDAVRSCDTRGYLFVRKVDTSVPELAQLMRTGQMPAG
jgi:core-2/I-Branching enzyme